MVGLKLERGTPPLWLRAAIPLAAVAVTFLLTSAVVVSAGANPFEAFFYLLIRPLSAPVSALEVLVKATPLLLTGLGVAFAFTAGYYNIGAEGQLYAGAMAAAWIGQLPALAAAPSFVLLPLMLAGGFAAGAAWAFTPAFLRTRLGVDEVVTTLLLNTVMAFFLNAVLNGPWLDPVINWPQSPLIWPGANYPVLVPRSRLHLGLLVGVALALALWWVITRTPLGLKMRAVGLGREAARFMGVNVGRTVLTAALVSGGIAGLAGVGEVAGIHHRLLEDISPGYGYSGIVIATLGALHPFGVAAGAAFIALILTGGQTVSRQLGIPTFLSEVVQATLLLVTLAMLLLRRYRVAIVRPRKPSDQQPVVSDH